ncbi:MAG: DoxX family protein [Candidatus Pacebacteria bacterium]|nr:DoxX family protein [Candidatus Paceibacterota bacterium]MBP9701236.1 DoxX family protein [Candidatus Paceibacterota bacterium]
MQIVFIIGRILLGGYLLYSGYNHFKNLNGMTGYAKMKGVPLAKAAVIISGIMLALAGIAIVTNKFAILGMCLAVLMLIPTTFMMHKFWKETDMQTRMNENINFTKNLALIGALLLLISIG